MSTSWRIIGIDLDVVKLAIHKMIAQSSVTSAGPRSDIPKDESDAGDIPRRRAIASICQTLIAEYRVASDILEQIERRKLKRTVLRPYRLNIHGHIKQHSLDQDRSTVSCRTVLLKHALNHDRYILERMVKFSAKHPDSEPADKSYLDGLYEVVTQFRKNVIGPLHATNNRCKQVCAKLAQLEPDLDRARESTLEQLRKLRQSAYAKGKRNVNKEHQALGCDFSVMTREVSTILSLQEDQFPENRGEERKSSLTLSLLNEGSNWNRNLEPLTSAKDERRSLRDFLRVDQRDCLKSAEKNNTAEILQVEKLPNKLPMRISPIDIVPGVLNTISDSVKQTLGWGVWSHQDIQALDSQNSGLGTEDLQRMKLELPGKRSKASCIGKHSKDSLMVTNQTSL